MLLILQITCATELNCVAVAEGYTADGADLTLAFVTTDGGTTWLQSFSSTEDFSLMGAAFASPTDVWILGTSKSGRQLYGQYRLSTNGGQSFSIAQSFPDCSGIDVSFGDDGVGYSICLNSAGTAGSVVMYQ